MMFYIKKDELNRYCGFKVYTKGNGQEDTHGVSYLYARNLHKEIYLESCKSNKTKPESFGLELNTTTLNDLIKENDNV